MKALVAGWFSFEQMGATAGDLLTRDLACSWLDQSGFAYDVAVAPPFTGGVDWREVAPADYSHVLFVCGPFGNGEPVVGFLERFEGRAFIGLNLSMLESLDRWNPFDLLLERDSSRTARPDLAFLAPAASAPVVGVVLVHAQKEYKGRGRHQEANEAIERLIASRDMAVVQIDTRLDVNATGLRSAAEVESLIARMDIVVTTRLHGTVLALKHGIPVVAIDPVAGGAKITRQAETVGWPLAFPVETVSDEALREAFAYCLTDEARRLARTCASRAVQTLENDRDRFLTQLRAT